jgi:hypothetical protein
MVDGARKVLYTVNQLFYNVKHDRRRYVDTEEQAESRETKVTGLRLTSTDLDKLKYVADRRSNGDKTEAMRVLIREEFDRLKKTDLLVIIAELERRIEQLENKT